MTVPVYFRQESNSTCSLAVLRMVLASYGISVSEGELVHQIRSDYGPHFKNIWNPTIAKLSQEYGIKTEMYALWPLFQKQNLKLALTEYKTDPKHMNILKYENKKDADSLPEPLPIAYKEMFEAVKKGCLVVYGQLTEHRIKNLISQGYLIQTSINFQHLYTDARSGFHSILLYDYSDEYVFFHDPDRGKSLKTSFKKLKKATLDVGAAIVYKGL